MGEYFVDITEKAENDILKIYKSGNKDDINKLNKILVDLSIHPKIGTGNPEQQKQIDELKKEVTDLKAKVGI